MKTCNKCQKTQPDSQYYPDNRRKGGLSYYCKSCNMIAYKDWYRDNRDHANDLQKQRYTREQLYGSRNKKVAFRKALVSGMTVIEAINILGLDDKYSTLWRTIITNDGSASLEELMTVFITYVRSSADRRQVYNELFLAIHRLKRNLKNTGFEIVHNGYGKGYSIVEVSIQRKPDQAKPLFHPRKKQADVL